MSGSTWKYIEALPLPTSLYRTLLLGAVESKSVAMTVVTRLPIEEESSMVTGRIADVKIGALSFLSWERKMYLILLWLGSKLQCVIVSLLLSNQD